MPKVKIKNLMNYESLRQELAAVYHSVNYQYSSAPPMPNEKPCGIEVYPFKRGPKWFRDTCFIIYEGGIVVVEADEYGGYGGNGDFDFHPNNGVMSNRKAVREVAKSINKFRRATGFKEPIDKPKPAVVPAVAHAAPKTDPLKKAKAWPTRILQI